MILKIAFFSLLFLLILFPNSVFADDQVLVKFKNPLKKQEITNKFKVKLDSKIKNIEVDVLKVPEGKATELVDQLKKESEVEYAEVDHLAFASSIPNDPFFQNQWGLAKIQAPEAWNFSQGGEVDIAIVDTGVDSHRDLLGKVIKRANFTLDPDTDKFGHGTHVAGIAGALTNNSLGTAGLGYNARLFSAKVLDQEGSGFYSWVANGIIWSADSGAEVINLSLGGPHPSITLENAINYAWGRGVVVVAAAGNRAVSRSDYPAFYDNTISVAATDYNDSKATFSNFGPDVDVAAPGVSILSTLFKSYYYMSGTSMATPFVSGLAALVKAQNPTWSNLQVRDKIESSADKIPGTGYFWTHGRINSFRALMQCIPLPFAPCP